MRHAALVMAARRRDVTDPLAEAGGVSHKCLIDMDGAPMIERVVASLLGARSVGEILISIDDPAAVAGVPLIAKGLAEGRIRIVPAGENLWLSTRAALDAATLFPAIVCTADNALQTAEMVDHFTAACARDGCDVGVAVTNAETIWAKYPDGQRRPHRFRDGKWSNCNLFFLRSIDALKSAKAFEGGGQFGKSKRRVVEAFGLFNLLLYVSGLMTLRGVFARISRRFGVRVTPIEMPWAEAPIDVDNERTRRIAHDILVRRREAGVAA